MIDLAARNSHRSAVGLGNDLVVAIVGAAVASHGVAIVALLALFQRSVAAYWAADRTDWIERTIGIRTIRLPILVVINPIRAQAFTASRDLSKDSEPGES